jgi:PhoPQ-activated pathogenicity-related protein
MDHQYRAYGRYSEAVQDYVDMNIFPRFSTPAGQELLTLVDPYQYLERLDFPKLIINSTGDQFFLPDSLQFYFHDLPGNNYVRFIPNTDHGLSGYEAVVSNALPVFRNQLYGTSAPQFSWVKRADGAIVVTVGTRAADKPSSVKLWQATNTTARDFRLETIGPAWTSTTLTPDANGAYVALPPTPAQGWTAFMVELTIPSADTAPYVVTTEVRVIPDVLPYPSPF